MDRIETVRTVHEVRGAFGRAPNTAQFGDVLRLDAHVVHGFENALGSWIVASTGGERGLSALVIDDAEADAVDFRFRSFCFCSRRSRHLLALHGAEFVSDGARIERQSVEMADAAQTRSKFWFEVELEQTQHLCVAILLDDVDAIVLFDEFMNLAGKRISTEPQVIGFNRVLVAELVAAFSYAPMRSTVSDDSDLRCLGALEHFRTRHEGACGLELAIEALHIIFVI